MKAKRLVLLISLAFLYYGTWCQNYLRNWYFGTGTDGLVFINNTPQKVSDKLTGVGFEGMINVNDPLTGNLLFYSDGQQVVDKFHNVMSNGSGMTGHMSGAQCVQSCPVPGTCTKKFYLFTNSAWDNTSGAISYSIVDFTSNPLGEVTNKNTLLWNGPSDEAMCLVNKPGTYDYWLINNEFTTAAYRVWPITASGIGAPVTYTFSNTGETYQMSYDKVTGKIAVSGWPGGTRHLTLLNFNSTTGVLSNEVEIAPAFQACWGSRFSPDGTKLYAGVTTSAGGNPKLFQYNFTTSVWTDMNTCCYAHDLKMGPDGKMYHIHTYNSSQPMAVIDFPNLSAVGNACNYRTITFSPAFNGEVRRFPEFVILPEPPLAIPDVASTNGAPVSIPVLLNDSDPQNDPFSIDAIIKSPVFGTATIAGNNISYTPLNATACGITDTLIYRIKDINCDVDTALVLVNYPACAQASCNNWLSSPSHPSYLTVGDVDVTGNQLTVEALINGSLVNNPGGNWGKIVSKHSGPADVNYSLMSFTAEITTTNGYVNTPPVCMPQFNKTYHVAMVYNGSTLKFYRNGYLMSSIPWTGNLVNNDLLTTIAHGSAVPGSAFQHFGYTNEVRIWNTARTQTEIRNFMNSSLPSPTTTPGLVAYYTFDNLQNKQGNAAFNGTLNGSAAINQPNPQCNFVADSCPAIPVPISNIINLYTPVLAFDPCKNELTVENAAGYNVGDTVLMIQMKGAVIDSSNTAAFGTITDYKSAGNYEFNYIAAKNGNLITLKNKLLRTYEIPAGKVQLIRVPYYDNASITSTLTCAPWDGSKGGVLVLNVKDTIFLNADIDVQGKGFKGGQGSNSGLLVTNCFTNGYNYANTSTVAAEKGESIAIISNNISRGKGAPAGGGGGGLDHNSGGGGGGNGGAGGFGGYQLEPCGNPPFDNRGTGGKILAVSNAVNKVFMGGGGGAGHANNPGNIPPSGANGGGIAIIKSGFLQNNGKKIIANGGDAVTCAIGPSPDCHDGMGGGGGGGSVLLNVTQILNNIATDAKGGKGADMSGSVAAGGRIGSGGGGGGGVVWVPQAAVPGNVTAVLTGGLKGVLLSDGNNAWGATDGQNGIALTGLQLPVTTTLFKLNIDSVRIRDSATGCSSFDFKGLAYTNTVGIQNWQWFFGDGNTANTQNTVHTYTATGPFTVKLVVTDLNGCKDSITKIVTPTPLNFDFSYRFNTCNPLSVQFEDANTAATGTYWNFGDNNTAVNTTNPVHTYGAFGNYTVKYSTGNGICRDTVTKTISITLTNDPTLITTGDTTVCKGSSKQLLTKPALSFCWTPATWLNNPLSPTPITTPQQNITYYYTAEVTGANLVTNGDFSAGNTGFTSAYNFANPNITEGEYFVGPSPQAWNPSLSNCPDHTTGAGNMLLVNGSPVNGVKVWTQTVAVTPNTNYAFSAWLQALWPPNPAQLQFSINGKNIGQPFIALLPTCTWKQFYYNWNSGPNTSATISIVNRNTQIQGNDFALDDIAFAPVFLRRDSVRITLDSAIVRTSNDTAICAGASAQLNTTGGASYSWTPPTGLSNPAIGNPVATPSVNTQYIVTGANANGCQAKDTVNIAVTPLPVITVSNDTAICRNSSVQLTASGGNSYVWTPGATLSNPNIANPVASPAVNTLYYVTVGNGQCSNRDSVLVTIRPKPIFNKPPDQAVCDNLTAQLNSNNNTAWQYQWSPSQFLSNAQSAAPVFTPGVTTAYTVHIAEPVCSYDSIFNVQVTVNPSPGISATKTNDIDCVIRSAQLNATGGLSYVWSPATGLSSSNIANPLCTAGASITYQVSGVNAFGCTGTDTITVAVANTGQGLFELPSAFTPNNDGVNDCFGIKNWGSVTIEDFAVYNRWGERVWSTTSPNECWNGIYKGVPQPPATFVYYIKAKSPCGDIFRKGTVILIR